MHIVPAILCGGSGTRLWPLSRASAPKQFHPLLSPHSLLQETVMRVAGVAEMGAPILVANEALAHICENQLDALQVSGAEIILEPMGKNTAPAAALAALAALRQSPDAIVLMLPSDHHVGNVPAFHEAIAKGASLAAEGRLVTFGITPTEPNTGYGYIAAGAPVGQGFEVARFVEKPPLDLAKQYLAEGTYSWNAGIFMFRADFYLSEMQQFEPAMMAATQAAWDNRTESGRLRHLDREAWANIAGNSIDYAVAEKTKSAAVVPVDMAWNDVGSWSALYDIAAKDAQGNVLMGHVVNVGSTGSYVRAHGDRTIAVIGVQDLVVVETEDSLIILPRERAQDVKAVVDALKGAGRKDRL